MSRLLAIIVTVAIMVIAAVYGWLWLSAQRTIPLSVSAADRAAAMDNADRIADLGHEPGQWPVRLFIPASALQDMAGTVVGTTVRVPVGARSPSGPDGYLVATVRNLEFIPTDFQLRVRLKMDVTYSAVRTSPWWGDATVRFTGNADMLPVHAGPSGSETLGFRLIPKGFSPAIGWGPLNVAATEMLSQVVASHFLERLGRDLVIPIPALSVPINIQSGMVSTHQGRFPAGGSYRFTALLDEGSLRGEIATDRMLIVSSGVWLLGGVPEAAKTSPSLPRHTGGTLAHMDQRALATKARLEPFERTSGDAEAHIPIAPILSMIAPENGLAESDSAARPGYDMRGVITEARGTVLKRSLINNRVVGDIYLAVSPATPDLASGTLSLAPRGLQWRRDFGLSGELDVTIQARAQFRPYLSGSRLSQALGADLAVNGTTKTTIPFTLGLKLMRGADGSAVMLVPDARCTRVAVDLRQDDAAGPLFSTRWYSLQSAGIRIERNIGGGAAASFSLIDSKPRYVPFPAEAPLITWPSDGVAVTTTPKALVMGEKGIDVTLSLHARPAGKAEQADFAAGRAGLHAALRERLPEKPCVADQRFRLLL